MQFEFFCQIYWSFSSSFKYVENREQGDLGVNLQRFALQFNPYFNSGKKTRKNLILVGFEPYIPEFETMIFFI